MLHRIVQMAKVLCFSILLTSLSHAETKVVVIPLLGDDIGPLATAVKIPNVVTVAKDKGDYTSVVAAMDSISDASNINPYVIKIFPGNYNIGSSGLTIKPFVELIGSGRDNTFIEGNPTSSFSGGVLNMSLTSAIKDLTVRNNGVGPFSVGVVISNVAGIVKLNNANLEPRRTNASIENSNIIAISGSANTVGVNILDSSHVLIRDTYINSWATPGLTSPQTNNWGMNIAGSNNVTIKGSTIRSVGGYNSRGIVVQNLATILVESSSVTAAAGQNINYGMNIVSGSTNEIRHSYIEGEHSAIRISNNGTVNILGSHLYPKNGVAVVKTGGGTAKCISTVNHSYSLLAAAC